MIFMGRFILFFFIAVSAACAALPASASVMTTEGPVEGTSKSSVNVYKGIPFAAPPVGDLRWKPPAPPLQRDDVLNAKKAGLPCVQSTASRPGVYSNPPKEVSEDCLTLNIWSPKNAKALPVFVWIHGGALTNGSGSEEMYDGRKLAKEGVLVVSINYRLGILGYLAHPELSAESEDGVSGNYGLLDQIAALKWIQSNISAFGGDANNVTIAGESAGALSVLFLMSSPQAHGLFHKAIAQSAYMISMPELKKRAHGSPSAETIGAMLTSKMGAPTLQELRNLSAEELTSRVSGQGYFPVGTVDGKYLPRQMVDVFDAGEQAQVPVLTGFNQGEIRTLRALAPEVPDSAEIYETAIRENLGDLADDYLAVYPSSDLKESILAGPRDSLYGWTANRLVRKQTELGHPSFLYFFNHGYAAAQKWGLHAFHASEIPYVFDSMDDTPPMWPKAEDSLIEKKLTNAMMAYWVSFAKSGQPTAKGEADWPAFDSSGAYMHFANAPLPARNLLPGMYELHEEIVCRRRQDGTQAWHWNTGIASPILPPRKAVCE